MLNDYLTCYTIETFSSAQDVDKTASEEDFGQNEDRKGLNNPDFGLVGRSGEV